MTTSTNGLIVAASLAALFFGIQLVLYALLGYTLLTGGAFKGRIVVLSTASLLTVMSLSNMALSILYAEQSTESETEGGDLAGIDVTIKVFGRISLLIAQLIVIWRTWILWSTSVAVRALLAFLAFASCATTIISIGLCFVASLSTATVASDALVMLVPLVVANAGCLLATSIRVRCALRERTGSVVHASHWGRMARLAAFLFDSGLILGAFFILYLGSEVASGGIDNRSNTTSSATNLTRALTGTASGVASTLTILVFLLVVHRISTADVLLRADRDDADTARDDHTLASSTTWRMSKNWKREKEKWDQSDLGSSDRATISTVDELPRYSRHMRDAKAFPVQEPPQLSPPRPTRPLHVEKAMRPRTEGALVEEQPRSWHAEYGRDRVDTAERRPHSSPSLRTAREDTIPSETRDTTPSGKQNTAPTAEQDIVEVPTAPTPHTVFAGWQTDRPLELRPFTLPPPTSRPRTAHTSYPLVTRSLSPYTPRRGSLPAQSPPRASGASQSQTPPSHSVRPPQAPASHAVHPLPTSRPSATSKRPSHTYSSSYVASPLHSIRELPPPPAPESEADASESTYVHAPESLYSRAPDSDGAPSPQSSVESIADPPTAWRWPGPNPSSYRDHAPYQHHDYAPYRHHALSRSAVSNLSSPSAYSVDSMALAIRDAADPLELYGNYLWGLKMAGEGEPEEKRSHGDRKQKYIQRRPFFVEMNAEQALDSAADARPHLPLELLEHVAGYTDRSTQLALALVCHALVNFSRCHTFQALRVRRFYKYSSCRPGLASAMFAALLGSPLCSFGPYTKYLTLTIGSFEEGLFNILRHLPNLTDLRVEGTRFMFCVLTDDHLLPSSSQFPTVTNLTLNHVVIPSFSTLTSILVALPGLRTIELLWVSTRPKRSSNETVNPSTSARLGGALAQLRILQMKIVYAFDNSLQRQLLAWILELPQFPPIEELGLSLHGSDSDLPRPLNAFMRRTMLSLKKWAINPGEYRNFLRVNLRGLDFSQFSVLHTVILDPIGLCSVRKQDHRENGRFSRFMLQVLAAPALRTLIVHLKVDEEHSILDWETEQLDWAALDAALLIHPSLEKACFIFHLDSAFMQSEPAKRAMFTSVSYLPKLLPRTNAKGKIRPGILAGTCTSDLRAGSDFNSSLSSFRHLRMNAWSVENIPGCHRSSMNAHDATLPRLPLELLERIMILIPDTKTYLNSALVCRALVDVSRRLMFRRIRFYRLGSASGYDSFKTFEALLESPVCTITRYVRWAALHWPLSYDRNLEEPLSCLRRLPNLATLRVEGMRDYACVIPLHEIVPYGSSKSLTSVSLDRVVVSSFESLVRMLAILRNLQGFSLHAVSLEGGQGARILHRPLSKPEGLLGHLRRLKCYLQGPLERGFFWFMLSLPCLPPIAYLDIRLPTAGSGRSTRLCKFIHGLRHTLRALRIHPGYRNFVEAEYTKLNLPQFTSLSSITIEPVLLYNLRTAGTGDCLLSLLSFSLTAPSLSKLTVVFMVDHERSVDALGASFHWEILDIRLERAKYLEEMKFVVSGCSVIMQLQGVHRKAVENIRKLLPKAHAEGILRVKVSSVAIGECSICRVVG
ncbi:hypothetical protein EV121DRAFT_194984 [Schizophyllum commune]